MCRISYQIVNQCHSHVSPAKTANALWKKYLLFCCMVWLAAGQATAQVNLQTGGATYSLPVFNWKDQQSSLSTSISLNYNSGNGLKVTDVASNVGQGWELAIGGVITRLQVGEPDDQKALEGAVEDVNKYPAGFLYRNNSYYPLAGCPQALARYPLYKDKNHIYKQHNFVAEDREKDYFAYQFNGRSGIFVLQSTDSHIPFTLDNEILFVEQGNLLMGRFYKDEALESQGIRTVISHFEITDENGITYTFSQRSLTKVLKSSYCDGNLVQERVQPKFDPNGVYHEASFDQNQANPFVVGSWYLSEMKYVTGRKVTFNYEMREINASSGTDICYYQQPDYSVITHKKSVSRTPVLASVDYPDGHRVVLNYGKPRVDLQGDLALASIDILYKQRYLSRYQLNTSYFILNRYGTPVTEYQKSCARLCLLSVQKLGPDLKSDERPYRFDYYTGSDIADDFVPPPFYHLKDIWGYYNGDYSKASDGSPISLTASVSSLQNYQLKGLCFIREVPSGMPFNVKPGYARNGLLRQVIYSAGGALRYEYEQNTGILAGATINAGGVHVSKTSVSDGGYSNGCANPIVTEYNYVTEAGTAPSLWGLETPVTTMDVQNYYEPEYKAYKYKFPIGTCYYKYQYPGILSRESAVGTTDAQQFFSAVSKVMNVLGPALSVMNVVALATKPTIMAWVGAILDIISGVIDIVFTCFVGPPTQDQFITIHYNTDLNSANPLPAQFKRVEVVPLITTGTLGKTVHEFTSNDQYPIWHATNPHFSMKQRFAPWAYGLPLRTSEFDRAGHLLKQTENTFAFWADSLADLTPGVHIPEGSTVSNPGLSSCKCTVIKSSSQRNTDWESSTNYEQMTLVSTNDLFVEITPVMAGSYLLENTTEKTFDAATSEYLQTRTTYDYTNTIGHLPTAIETLESNGDINRKRITYGNSLFVGWYGALHAFRSAKIISTSQAVKKAGTSAFVVLDETVTEYETLANTDYKPVRILVQRFKEPVPEQNMVYYVGPGNAANPPYHEIQSFTYDAYSNLASVKDEGQHCVSNIYGYDRMYVTAAVINADINLDKIAYTSFETGSFQSTATDGGWTLSGSPSFSAVAAVTGAQCLNLTSATLTTAVQPNRPYRVSFWMAAATPVINVTGGTATLAATTAAVNGFTYYEYTLTQGAAAVEVSGNGNIDELRLYPVTARMRTVSYDPVLGKTADCDENNRISYYEYDVSGKIRFIRNENRDIVKMYEYAQSGKYGGCPEIYYNHLITEQITRNDCPAGYKGGEVTYTIPANKYSSTVSQADADLQVENELNTLGQAYANTNGACIKIYYNVAVSKTELSENCPAGYVSAVTYTVPADKYSSIVSQEAADQLAQDDIDANAVAYANAHPNCVVSTEPEYETTGTAPRCKTVNGYRNGHMEVEMKDINPNSPGFNGIIWADLGENTAECPVEDACATCTGENKKCINNECMTGIKLYTSSVKVGAFYHCTYHYSWLADGSVSQDYTELKTTPCF